MPERKLAAIKIDRDHARKLVQGEAVTIVVPNGIDRIKLTLDIPERSGRTKFGEDFAKIIDVFFNGRKA